MPVKIMTIVGARPNFMKAAPIIGAIREHNERAAASRSVSNGESPVTLEHILVHTGQHYDEAMSDRFFADLRIPKPDVHLGVGSGSHAVQTAEILKRFEEVLLREKPDLLVVVGDVNSTLGCALVAAKISFDFQGTRPLIAHVEAGLRSFDRGMPEEINRVLTDHLADLLFVTEESGIENLCQEGIPRERIHFVGNTMIDSLLAHRSEATQSTILHKLGLRASTGEPALPHNGSDISRYALLTLHRPSNVDHRPSFLNILKGLEELSAQCPVIFPAHPRTRARIAEFGLGRFFKCHGENHPANRSNRTSAQWNIVLVNPLGYLDFLCLMMHAALVVTDSGGIQEETTCLGVPCVTARNNTERPITVTCGTNFVAGTEKEGIRDAIRRQMNRQTSAAVPEKWDGRAGARVVETILSLAPFLQFEPSREALSTHRPSSHEGRGIRD
jgi:UDP-N-acetylglucosamine 2-epimerase (non-hydrolysing)